MNKTANSLIDIESFKSFFKKTLKKSLQRIIFKNTHPIVIASSGRSGSTMLASAISEALVINRYSHLPSSIRYVIKRVCLDYLDRLEEIESSLAPLIKTHDIFKKEFKDSGVFIFVFGDPLESAQSVERIGEKRGSKWIEEHIYHLAGEGTPQDLFTKDVLNYEAQIKSWGSAQGAFVVHYDDIWNRVSELNSLLGFDVCLPEKRARSPKSAPQDYNKELFEYLKTLENELRSRTA